MSATFIIRPGSSNASGRTSLLLRVWSPEHHLNTWFSMHLSVSIRDWKASLESATKLKRYQSTADWTNIKMKAEAIKSRVNDMLSSQSAVTKEDISEVIDSIVNADKVQDRKRQEEARRKAEEEANRMTLHKFFDRYLEGRKSDNTRKQTWKNIRQSYVQLKSYEADMCKGKELDFADMTMGFYTSFKKYLGHYKENTIGSYIKNLKVVLGEARKSGYHSNSSYMDWSKPSSDCESIALTEEELEAISNVDLSSLPSVYDKARDLFLVGVYSCQRISDYDRDAINNVVEETLEDGSTFRFIALKQVKTGTEVVIPMRRKLDAIMSKYDYNLPTIPHQKLNEYIKKVAKLAGLVQEETYTIYKGTGKEEITLPRYERITSHTARRTGATLLWMESKNGGVSEDAIRLITGHSTTQMLKKYLKTDTIDKAHKLMQNKFFQENQ